MMAKSAIDKGCEIDLANARAIIEIQACTLCFSTQDIEEGVAAFLEKREPRFIGR
jgi:enoyl-CoA hydratase/carnithine racemase